jgi:predicted anti-sigma-YlaC factor YlaD
MSCETYREMLAAYLDDSLDEVRRASFRAHLRSCASCRAFALAEEPTLIFALAAPREPEPARVEACVTAVTAGIRQERLRRQLREPRRPWLAAAAAVLMAVAGVGGWWLGSDRAGVSTAYQAEVRDDAEVEATLTREGTVEIEPPPRIEIDMAQEEVRVYQYAIENDDSTGAVFIVNPGMEL